MDPRDVEAWGGFLGSVPWDLWCTWTFDRPVGYEVGERAARRWIGVLEDARRADLVRTSHQGTSNGWPGLGYILAAEKPIGHAWPHWHGLLVGLGACFIRPHWQRWFRREGMGRFERVESARWASLYCVKESYLVKDPGCELTLSDNLGAWMMASPVVSSVSMYPRWSRTGYHAEREPEVPAGRRALGAPVARSVAPAGEVVDPIGERVDLEGLMGRYTWWEDSTGSTWSLGRGEGRGSAIVRARVSGVIDGRWWVTLVGAAGGLLGPYATVTEARDVAFDAVVSMPGVGGKPPERPSIVPFQRSLGLVHVGVATV